MKPVLESSCLKMQQTRPFRMKSIIFFRFELHINEKAIHSSTVANIWNLNHLLRFHLIPVIPHILYIFLHGVDVGQDFFDFFSIIMMLTSFAPRGHRSNCTDVSSSVKRFRMFKCRFVLSPIVTLKPNDLNIIILSATFFSSEGTMKNLLTLINLVFNCWKLTKYDSAKYYLLEAIQKSTRYNDSWIYYAELLIKTNYIEKTKYKYTQILKQFNVAQKSAPDTINAFTKSIDLDPENNSAFRYLAVDVSRNQQEIIPLIYYHNLNKYQEAEHCFKKCIKLKPQRYDLYKNI
ncbi:UDP-N-acetylglucosamine--peptide N-acetylglucosaminyltransferase 110 kDa subunit-like [Aphis craccivora]|uniref:UDP-N-acetylglucosamine--peptide N-acetylglucosaminyltransferase 110 kDa subunit-like n=1 Tax=Aphis craccivora TaxID=307492 RepID=A0A6G0VXM5_APHCR|nr:UDP-N-acetylglucosamine--peptide N-acetylglucosaminyltransferase 110 kDa subunit-like [Aphis craccivora]